MRILIITSCTGQKVVKCDQTLTERDFLNGPEHLAVRERGLEDYLTPANELYSGQQHLRLMRGIRDFRERNSDATVDLFIVSAGYGIVTENQLLAPYECTFSGRKKKDLHTWANQLNIPEVFRKTIEKPYDLGLLLLGADYLLACQLNGDIRLGGSTIAFCGQNTAKKLPALTGLIPVTMGNLEAKRFSCGLVGLKGEIASRLLRGLVNQHFALTQIVKPGTDILSMLDQDDRPKVGRSKPRPNPKVDQIIQLPDAWRNRCHRKKLRYFIPEWDDLVDPDYDFEGDTHSGGSGDWSNEVYAHQMYPEPNYDGILVSKVVAEKSKKKKKRINQMGVHRYLRVPRDFPIMGDCGAFGYIMEDVPPYTTEEILDYYTRLDFDLGVSVDHLIVSATEAQKTQRYQLTIQNAEDFLYEHGKRNLLWTPIGAVQGWDPKSYAQAARQYVAMGYKYIALGGLVRTPTKDILRVLEEVHKVVPGHVAVHLFGVARLNAVKGLAKFGVRSVDSASLLRRAWMGTGQNYLEKSGQLYAAIRIPEAAKSFRAKRMVSEGRASLDQVQKLERACLKAMRDFDHGKRGVENVLDVLMDYDHLITPDRPDNRHLLKKTLEAVPWQGCNCDICRRDGIDVIIFRGNNRNRRRGFHNTFVFYRLLQRALEGEIIELGSSNTVSVQEAQLDLFKSRKVNGI